MNHLTDLDELIEKVIKLHPRQYIKEAVTVYRAGAYRSAIAITWVAVCIDIIEKIRDLSSQGVKAAVDLEDELGNIKSSDTTKLLNFENKLLKVAEKDLQIISPIESRYLRRIKEDRNTSVHPSFQHSEEHPSPLPENARTHITQACKYLLTLEPIQGKALCDQIINLVKEGSFPENNEDAQKLLSSNRLLGRAKESVTRNVCICILKELFNNPESIEDSQVKRYGAALNALKSVNPNEYNKTINEKLNPLLEKPNDLIFKRIFLLLYFDPMISNALQEHNHTRIKTLIEKLSYEDFIEYKIQPIYKEIEELIILKVKSFNECNQTTILSKLPHSAFKRIALDLFLDSKSFITAYSNGINLLVPHSQFFKANEIEELLEKSLNYCTRHDTPYNQILEAHEMDTVFQKLYQATTGHIEDSRKIWTNFWEKLLEKKFGHMYPLLEEALLIDEVIANEGKDTVK